MNSYALYWVALYVIVLFALSIFCIKKAIHSYSEYSYCGRSLTFSFIVISYLGTWIGGGTVIGLAGEAYKNGAGQYWIIGISCIVQILFAVFFLRKIRALGLKSVGDFLASKYPDHGQIVRLPCAIAIIIRNVTMTGMQFSAIGYMVTYVFQIDKNLSLLAVFLIITSYTLLSGLWGVVVTDIFQGVLQISSILLLVLMTLKFAGGIDEVVNFYYSTGMEENLNLINFNKSFTEIITYIVAFGLFFFISDQSDWQRIYSSKTDKTAFWGFIIPLVITLMIIILPVYLGVFQKALQLEGGNSEIIIYKFIFEVLGFKLACFILVGLMATIMSSADSFMLANGVLFSNEIVKRFINKNAGDTEMIFWARAFIILTGAMGFAFAINTDNILFLWMLGIGMASVILVPAYFLGWFTSIGNSKGILIGMVFGLLFCICISAQIISSTANVFALGIFINLIISITMSFFTKKSLKK